ncbi:STAS domain-containing protein [Streptomyces niveus]|uniref:STAS domain-containing protein n=1 Tax=Streptomyces niveus TaxID=193462 RepID=UPI0035E0EC65
MCAAPRVRSVFLGLLPWPERSAVSRRRPGRRAGQRRQAVVRLRGEITAVTVGRTGRQLSAALAVGPPVLEIDLARVTLLTRDGTEVFFGAVRTAQAAGIPVVISNARPRARATMHTIGLDRVLHYSHDT